MTPSARTPSTSGLARFYGQRLHWAGCGSGFQCSSLLVPVDYAHPRGATMHIAVIRKPSTVSHKGSLLYNPGGPGASGVDFARGAVGAFAGPLKHYDFVSFDPRGVGRSRPIRCITGPQLDEFIHLDPTPDNPAEHAAVVRGAKFFAVQCWNRNHGYLEHVGTIDQARDMDVLRAALGDRKLTYYGASYGTYLGLKYAQLFPRHIRVMVLDGAIDPTQSTMADNEVQATGFEADLHDFLVNCAANSSCSLGSSYNEALQSFNRLATQVDRRAVPVGSRSVGSGEFFEGVAAALYSTQSWGELRLALANLQHGNGALLLAFSDSLTERHSDGSYSNLVESNLAINCIDRPAPRRVSAYDAASRRFAKVSPHFGAAIAYGSLPCAFWPVPPVEQTHAVRAAGSPPILVIGNTRDPATPYVWSQAVARQLDNAVLLTWVHDGHTAYEFGDGCIVGIVNAYIDDRTVPKPGVRCR